MLRFLEEETLVETIVSAIGTMISISLNLTPILLFYRYFKKTAGLETIPETMFITGIFCSGTNLAYGIITKTQILIISNGVCFAIQVLYGTTYIIMTNTNNIGKLLLYLFIAWDLSFEVVYLFAGVFPAHTSWEYNDKEKEERPEVAIYINGIVNSLIGVFNVITPGQNIIKVFKTGNFTLIPVVTIIVQCACSSFWLVFGLSKGDPWMIIPNLLGSIIAALQIAVFYFFYCKNHGIPPVTKEEENEEDKGIKAKDSGINPIEDTEAKADNEQKLMDDSA